MNLKKKIDDIIQYRILTKDKKSIEVIDTGRLIHDENYGDIFFVYLRKLSDYNFSA